MRQPEVELSRLCNFIGEPFEPTQIEAGTTTSVVPDYELGWKGRAKNAPDSGRVAAWRKCEDHQLIARMNLHMGAMLRAMGYPDTEVTAVSWYRRMLWGIQYFPLRRGLFPITLRVNRLFRFIRTLVTGSDRSTTEPSGNTTP